MSEQSRSVDGNVHDRVANSGAFSSRPREPLATNMGSKRKYDEESKEQTTCLKEEKTYPASGLKHSLHGIIAQLKLAMLFVKRGLRHDYEFELAIEMDWADKFDDIVFRYSIKGAEKFKCRYLQVKHHLNESRKIRARDLLSKGSGDFSLHKYFTSYRIIKKHPELSKSELEDCIIYTNMDFDDESLRKADINLIPVVGSDHFLDFGYSSKRSVRYKLHINDNQHKLYKLFREDSNVHALPNEVQDTEIAEFLDKFVFAVNQPNEDELGHIIAREIAADSRHNLPRINLINDSFWKNVLDWSKSKKGVYLTSDDAKAMFESIEGEVDLLACIALSASCLEELEKFGVEFEGDVEDLKNFLSSGSSQNDFTQLFDFIAGGETFLTAIKVIKTIKRTPKYEKSDNLIFVRLHMLLELPMTKERIIRVFSSQKGCDLMVIDCGSATEQDLRELCKELYDMMRRNSDKKLILVTKVSSMKLNINLPNCQESYDAICRFDDLTENAQRKLKDQLKLNFPKLRREVLRKIITNPWLR